MENNIQLGGSDSSNSYLRLFKIARFNLRLFIKEEARPTRRLRARYQSRKKINEY